MKTGLIFGGLCGAAVALVLTFQNCSGTFKSQVTRSSTGSSTEPINDDNDLNRWTISSWHRFDSQLLVSSQNSQSLMWNVPGQIYSPHNLPADLTGTKIGVVVEAYEEDGRFYVEISQPFINTEFANSDVRIEGLAFTINDQFNPQNSTFKMVTEEFAKGLSNDTIISQGGFVQEVDSLSQIQIGLAVKLLESVTLESPPQITVEFLGPADITITEGSTLSLQVTMSHASPTSEVYVDLGVISDGSAIPDTERLTIKDRDDQDIDVSYSNIDFNSPLPSRPLFAYGETLTSIMVVTRNDEREEVTADETFELRLGETSGNNISLGPNDRVKVTILDEDPLPGNTEITYSMLTAYPAGPFYTACAKCHNSFDQLGGFDVFNYQNLISRALVIPGDSENSPLMQRLTSSNISIRMPQNAPALPDFEINLIRSWIDSGAKNN